MTFSTPHDWREGPLRAWDLAQQGWTQRAIAGALEVTEGAISPCMKRVRAAERFFVHVSDVAAALPRELWRVSDRVLPGADGMPLPAIVEAVSGLGYDGDILLELFDAGFEARWASDPVAAAQLAYQRCIALVPDGTRE